MWIWYIIGGLGLFLLLKKENQNASWFYVGQIVNIPATTMYSDAALQSDAGQWPGGTATIKVVDTTNNTIGFVGPSGAGLGGGAPAYVASSLVQATGRQDT